MGLRKWARSGISWKLVCAVSFSTSLQRFGNWWAVSVFSSHQIFSYSFPWLRPCVIGEMQTETTINTSIRIAKIQHTDNKWRWVYGTNGILVHHYWECKTVQPLWAMVLYRTNFYHTFHQLKTYVHTKTCTWMFLVALYINAKTWKQPICSSVSE